MNDRAVSPVIFPNPPSDIVGVRYEVIYSLRRRVIPIPYIMRCQPKDGSHQRGHSAQIGGMPIPEITHGRVTIADMRRVQTSNYSFHRPTIPSDHQVVVAQI